MSLNDFDSIAFIYDFLAKLVFGRSMRESQQYFLTEIRKRSKVLILGGGSGWLLEALLNQKPDCEVWYIEASAKMISLSKSKVRTDQAVHFIHGTEQDIPVSIEYDAVITNFYFDLFSDHELEDIVIKIQSSMRPGSLWIITDFVDNKKWWQGMMLKTMYWFFRITCNLQSQQLPDWKVSLDKAGVREIASKTFYSGFIKTVLSQV